MGTMVPSERRFLQARLKQVGYHSAMQNVVELTAAKWSSVITTEKRPILLDFYAPWCGPCKAFAPVLEQVAAELGDSVAFYKINIEEEERLVEHMKVTSVPTLIIVRNQDELFRETGAMPKRELIAKLNQFV